MISIKGNNDLTTSIIAPVFNMPEVGIQFEKPSLIKGLIKTGCLREIL